MAGTEKTLNAIRLANEAAVETRPWGDFLACLNDLVGGVFANLEIIDLASGRYVELQSTKHIDTNESYLEYYQSKNPRIERLLMTRQSPIVHDHQAFSETDIDRSEFYADFLAPHGLRYFAGISACHTRELFAGFSIQRATSHGNIDTDELTKLEALLPHLKAALGTYMKLGELQRQVDALTAMGDAANQPRVALGADGEVHFTNTAANAVFQRFPAMLRAGRLHLGDAANQAALEAMLSSISRGIGPAPGADTSFVLKGFGEPASPIKAHLSAIRSVDRANYPSGSVATLLLAVMPLAANLPQDALQRTFALSSAELELVRSLSAGASLREAAEHRQVRYDTVRKQLRSVMSKMGVHRQSDLQSLLTWVRT